MWIKEKNQGLFNEKGSAEPWILDPTADAAVDHVVHPAHGSTMDRAKGYPPDLIRTVRERSVMLQVFGRGNQH
jgi:hypothetical protein